jgi:hypothetical protein
VIRNVGRNIEISAINIASDMIRNFLLSIIKLILIISSTSIFLYLESPPIEIAQTGTATAAKQPQSSDQNHTFAETSKIIDGGNMSIILKT